MLFRTLLLCTVIGISGCATDGVSRAEQNQLRQEFYAKVTAVREVELESYVPAGIIIGSIEGAMMDIDGENDGEDFIAGAIAGAIVGGAFTALFEGSTTAFEYSLLDDIRGQYYLVQEHKLPANTDCVKVTLTNHAVAYAVDSAYCQNASDNSAE